MSNCCIQEINVTAADLNGTTLQLTATPNTFVDGRRYRIVIPNSVTIPAGIEAAAIAIVGGATPVPLWTCGPARSILGGRLPLFAARCCALQYVIPVEYVNTGVDTNPAHFTVLRRA